MTTVKTHIGRRSFIKNSTAAGGGLMLGFSLFTSCKPTKADILAMPKEWYKFNGYLKVGDNGLVTILSPNPEIGQNVKTSMPMIVAEELDVDWKNVLVEQAPLDTNLYKWQIAGGSRSIASSWDPLRMAGATAKRMLMQAAANTWKVPLEELSVEKGIISHKKSNKSGNFGEFASVASKLEVPKEVKLKDPKEFTIIGTSQKNVDGQKIATGQPLFGLDTKVDGMLTAMIVHPPAFGKKLKASNLDDIKKMPGIKDAFIIDTYPKGIEKQWCDVAAFTELVAIVGASTWQVMQAKKQVQAEYADIAAENRKVNLFGRTVDVITPAGAENTASHIEAMKTYAQKKVKPARRDGNPEQAFKDAAQIIERTYSCPFLAHNTMEPMNFFAHVTAEKAELYGPTQTPEFMEKTVAARLGMPLEKIEVKMSRMGGGFGRRLYGHFMVEAAVISQKVNAPVKLIYTREDDMTCGVYRPAYFATYRAALDKDKNLIAFHVNAGGVPEAPLAANRFPAGAIDNYLAEEWSIPSNISVGAFRAPRSNFIAGAEQAFLDELAEAMGKDPIQMRLDLLKKAKDTPVGKDNDYDAKRYAGVLELVKEKAAWDKPLPGVHRGVAAYFCHSTYVAHVLDIVMEKDKPIIQKVTSAVDCGIVVNPDAACNLSEGAIVDGIGHALYSAMSFKDGVPDQTNFNTYKLIRHRDAPRSIETHFVKSEINPTGMGEPSGPPAIGALANALYKATGKRYYHQPFFAEEKILG